MVTEVARGIRQLDIEAEAQRQPSLSSLRPQRMTPESGGAEKERSVQDRTMGLAHDVRE